MTITAIATNTAQTIYTPEDENINTGKNNQTGTDIKPGVVSKITENKITEKTAMTDEQWGESIRTRVRDVMPSLLSDYDEKWLKLSVELCKVLVDDSLSQQERRNKLEGLVMELAKQLKDLKYKEAGIQERAALTGALLSIGIAVIGAAVGGNGGQIINGLSNSVGQTFSQVIMAEATRLQGDAEVIRGEKDVLLSGMSAHSKVSEDQKESKKKFMDTVSRYFDNRQATVGNLINNMRT
ncbi:hypothetical protein [Morganella morganii]|uniref:hypothetical protein n=1 Tax=Morganella morganii TaxID=582 RepID=UPI0034D578BA